MTHPRANFLEIKPLAEHLNGLDRGRTTISTRNLYEILLLDQGSVTAKIGDVVHSIPSSAVYFLAPGQVSQINTVDKFTNGYYMAFDTDYFLLCLKNQVQLCFYPFFQIDQYPILHLTRRQQEKLVALIKKIDFEYKNRDNINDDLLSRLYLNVLLIEIERLYRSCAVSNPEEPSRKRAITSKFRQLVEKSFMTVRKVSEYADALYLSPNYLNDAVRETTGQSASEVIHDRIILEAKAKLIQTELSINEIAYQLNYPDASYFCRFFNGAFDQRNCLPAKLSRRFVLLPIFQKTHWCQSATISGDQYFLLDDNVVALGSGDHWKSAHLQGTFFTRLAAPTTVTQRGPEFYVLYAYFNELFSGDTSCDRFEIVQVDFDDRVGS